MKKIVALGLCLAIAWILCPSSFALQLNADAVKSGQVTPRFAKFKDGEVAFGKKLTGYEPAVLDKILGAYGLTMTKEKALQMPPTYAKVSGDEVVFGKAPAGYAPFTLHDILTAYGATLPRENVSMVPRTYAWIENGEIVFGKKATVYGPQTLDQILQAYTLPGGPAVQPTPVTPQPDEPDQPVTPAQPDEPVTPVQPDQPDKPVVTPPPSGDCPDADHDGVCDSDDECPNTPVGAWVNSVGCWVIDPILFDYDKYDIRPEYVALLDKIANILKANPDTQLILQGHTCDIGSKSYNLPLSLNRAGAIGDYLEKQGISSSRITEEGYWFSRPAAPNTNEANRKLNRRVEIKPVQVK